MNGGSTRLTRSSLRVHDHDISVQIARNLIIRCPGPGVGGTFQDQADGAGLTRVSGPRQVPGCPKGLSQRTRVTMIVTTCAAGLRVSSRRNLRDASDPGQQCGRPSPAR
jgi:hypothetical protein